MNQLAKQLNEQITNSDPSVFEMLSELGKELYMPKGIITQGAEAKLKAHKFNATIGTATTKSGPLYLECLYESFSGFQPSEVFPYAPTTGVPELRKLWKSKMIKENPLLESKTLSNPIVTNALTHGISIAADLFADKGDYIVMPDKFWGNYRLTFSVRRNAEIATFTTFNDENHFNVNGLLKSVQECGKSKGKVILLLNFPNNPTGYTPSTNEMKEIADGLTTIAESGVKIVVIVDDAYFGLIYDNESFKESIFGLLAERSKNLLAIKLDGATKEDYAWGLRVGFITFAATGQDSNGMLSALETKVSGIIRATISNSSMPSQSAIIKCLNDKRFEKEKHACFEIMRGRYNEVVKAVSKAKYKEEFTAYPFNSGYFMCIKLSKVDAEKLRIHLLDKYGVGVISTSLTDIRIAFSCVEQSDIEELFEIIYQGCKDLC